jgi:hypothetical protein
MTRSGGGTERPGGTSGPHRFVEPEDSRLGLAMSAARAPGSGWAPSVAMTDASVRAGDARCALPGCGRRHDDPIHLPPDEGPADGHGSGT